MSKMPPLKGLRVLELAGLAPGPFAGLLLADFGADVLRIDRPQSATPPSPDVLIRNKSSIILDLKSENGKQVLLQLIVRADILIDPFRPGVLENLGLSPDGVLLKLNPRLVVARLTGFRRDGKYASMAGHDINYLAVSGVLSTLGPSDKVHPFDRPLPPSPPGNLLADFAGGGLVCFTGILLALLSRSESGKGQVVEANMVDGVSYLATALRQATKIKGQWDGPRGENLIDGGCPYYNVYECKDDGQYMTVAGIEPKFFEELIKGLGLGEEDWGGKRDDRMVWPKMKALFRERFRSKTRKGWEQIFDGTDACCAPVLSYSELEEAGYDQRALVTLRETPSLDTSDKGWDVTTLQPGEGGEVALRDWMGWRVGKDYQVQNGAVVKKDTAKL